MCSCRSPGVPGLGDAIGPLHGVVFVVFAVMRLQGHATTDAFMVAEATLIKIRCCRSVLGPHLHRSAHRSLMPVATSVLTLQMGSSAGSELQFRSQGGCLACRIHRARCHGRVRAVSGFPTKALYSSDAALGCDVSLQVRLLQVWLSILLRQMQSDVGLPSLGRMPVEAVAPH